MQTILDTLNLSSVSKAVAGGLVTMVVALLSKYGVHPSGEVVSALGVILTAVVGYAMGHAAVYFAPKNKS